MNVSKIYNFNVKGSGVSPFGDNGSNEVRNYAEERRLSEKKATNFLKGAVAVSAVILAAAYAAKHGIFRRPSNNQSQAAVKPVENEVKESIQEIFAKRNPVKQIPAKYTQAEVPVEGLREDRLQRNSIDDLIPVSLVDGAEYAKCKDAASKMKFWQKFKDKVRGMSYYKQYEALSCYLDFIKKLDPSEVTITPVPMGLKRDNYERFMQKIMNFTQENPQFYQSFANDVAKYADNYFKYRKGGEKLDAVLRDLLFPPVGSKAFEDKSFRNNFCKNSMHEISVLPQEKQLQEFKNYLEFMKQIGSEKLKGIKFFNLRYFSENNLDAIRTEAAAFAKANLEFKDQVVEVLADEFIDFSKKCPEFADEIKAFVFPPVKSGEYSNIGRKAAFFTNSERYIAKLPPEKQVAEFQKYLEFIKSLGAEQVKDTILFIPGKFAGENNLKIAQEAINFAKNNPQFNDTIVSNLVAYEPDDAFGLRLADREFRLDANDFEFNMHADNIINIRRMLIDSGLRCDEKTRLKNRQDWMDIGWARTNQYTLGFQYSPKIADIRYAAFEYDMKQGITREEADGLIKRLSEADTIVKKRSMSDVLDELKKQNIPSEKAQNLFNQLIENKSRIRQKASEIDWSNVAEDKYQTTMAWLENSINEINSESDKIYQEFEQIGLDRNRAENLLRAITSSRESTDTEIKYGKSLDEMIARINNAVIS